MSDQNENEIRNSSYTGDFSNYHRPPIDINDTYNTPIQEFAERNYNKIQNFPDTNTRTQNFLKHLENLKKPTKGGRKKSLRKTNRKRKTRRRRTNRRR